MLLDPEHPRLLYRPIEPFDHGMLQVSSLHRIYYEQCGNPKGKPVVFLHGGPGGGGDIRPRRFFDPARYRIVIFDQRGCGRSTPHAVLEENTSWDLVADIEQLRTHLGIERWQVFGGSWGSTLSLLYAQTHPERVTELVLRGIFMLRRSELQWFYQHGASELFPEQFARYVSVIPEQERGDLISAFHRRLTGDDEDAALEAARAWAIWEGSTSSLLPANHVEDTFGDARFALAFARIESHYFINGGFMERETQILDDVDRIRHIPAVIVHGRYDVVCPIRSAWDLAQRWPEATLQVVDNAGHSAFEPGTTDALIRATDAFATDT
ncbi:MAG: prolyl aminopeptidase [Pseudomonadota bacterium]